MSNKEPGYVYILTRSTSGRLRIARIPAFERLGEDISKSIVPFRL